MRTIYTTINQLLKTIWQNLQVIHKKKNNDVYVTIRLYRNKEYVEWFSLLLKPGCISVTSKDVEYNDGYGLEVEIF